MKAKPSKLDQYAESLLQMDDEKLKLTNMIAWLKQEGVTISTGRLSEFLESLRQSRSQARLLGQIATGARQCAEVEKQFGQNPAPELETLIKLQRVLIMKLSTQATVDPAMLDFVGNLMSGVLSNRALDLKEQDLELKRDKFQIEVCEKFLAWFKDSKAREIAESQMGNAQKIAALRQEYFKDVDVLQKSGKVKLPE